MKFSFMHRQRGHLALSLLGLVTVMFGFGYALVPLYNVFCDWTGLNGKTSAAAVTVVENIDMNRSVSVEFMSAVNANGAWTFEPVVKSLDVHPGKLYTISYVAMNLLDEKRVAQAVPSVAPGAAAKHFRKTECFCFTEQAFEGKEDKLMPVTFMVDRDLPEHVKTITLSYTFFSKT